MEAPQQIRVDQKRFNTLLGTYWRAMETNENIYFANYQESDDSACVYMYSKKDLTLVSGGVFAVESMVDDMRENNFTYMAKGMIYNYNAMKKNGQLEPKEYTVLSPDGFAIDPQAVYKSKKEAYIAFEEWKKHYEPQGYYSAVGRQIALEHLWDYCTVKELDPE